MCRMLGMVSTNNGAAQAAPLPSSWHLVDAPHSLRVQAAVGKLLPGNTPGHEDSWGIGSFDASGKSMLARDTGSAVDSHEYEDTARAASSGQVVIGHLRKASCGIVNVENAHPIAVTYRRGGDSREQSLLVAHNGTLKEPLIESLQAELGDREGARSDSDTVVLATWLGMRLERSSAPLFETLRDSLHELLCRAEAVAPEGDLTGAYTGINLLMAAPEGLFVLRQFSKNPEYYTLFVRALTREETPAGGWLIASEQTDNRADWELLMPGELSFYSVRDGSVRKEMVVRG